jgi:two-component system cell cycle response regulator
MKKAAGAWYPSELEPLRAVAAGALDEDGALTEANAGFRKLLSLCGPELGRGAVITRFFVQPTFEELVRASDGDGELYAGMLTVGNSMGTTRTIRGRMWRRDGRLCVLAEYDVEELERLNDSFLELNREYAKAQLELAQTNLRLRQREAEIVALSLTDQLTGVGNRRRLEQAMALETARARRTGDKLAALMVDLDHFKRVNDTYGHEAGDNVLAAFGRILAKNIRPSDVAARYGGEEFVLLMPHTALAEGAATAERLREALASSRIEPLHEAMTASFGVAEFAPAESGEEFLQRIDKALYAAKESGRDRVVIS